MTAHDSDLNSHLIPASSSLIEAMERINSLAGTPLTLFALDADGKVAGSLTDGDIRRALVAGIRVDAPVAEAMHRDFLALRPDHDADSLALFALARAKGVAILPKLDADGRPIEIIDLRRAKSLLPLDAVMMAGGKGERLRPLTLETPKPLLKVGGKAIIDYNVEELEANGVERIFVTVNYLKEQIKEHFAAPRQAKVVCIEEPKRLGTIGSLALIDGLQTDNILLMNSDILTNVSFEHIYRHHLATGADLTMASIGYNVAVPFAILELDKHRVTGLREKPSFNYSANAGIYIIKRELLRRITPGEYLDAPDFIKGLIADGLTVSHFPITGTWIDIGSPSDFKYADELMTRPGR